MSRSFAVVNATAARAPAETGGQFVRRAMGSTFAFETRGKTFDRIEQELKGLPAAPGALLGMAGEASE